MRVIFMGTPEFSVAPLKALLDAGHEVVAVYSQPPRRAGRGKKERPGAVHAFAADQGLDVRHPTSLKSPDEQAAFAALEADIAVVVAYGLILPRAILNAPRLGCLNIHASLLPRWRGAAPIHRAIMAGDTETGICIMQMDEGLDTGDVLARKELTIGNTETTGELHDRLSELGADMIVETLDNIAELSATPQSADGVIYADKIDKAEARIDWTKTAVEIDAQIRGLSPFPGAWCLFGDERLKLLSSRVVEGAGAPGTCLNDTLHIACGSGAIELLRLQRSGKGAQDKASFLRGVPIPTGTVFN